LECRAYPPQIPPKIFLDSGRFVLAPRKPSKFETLMSTSMDELKIQKTQDSAWSDDQLVCSVSEPNIESELPEIKSVLSNDNHLFQEPSSLPPARQCDHIIPLIPGAQPVNVRSYRYALAQKTEIEKQLFEMLRQGTIRFSKAPLCLTCLTS
jgi:hypothetical protein